MAYILPQVQVFQEFRQLPTAVVANLNAFVFGPNFKLFRYSDAAEKTLIGIGDYDPANDTTVSYPFQPTSSTVDLGYVKLYMENVWAQYAAIPAEGTAPLACMSPSERNKLRAAPRIFLQAAYKGQNTAGVVFEDGLVGGFYTGGVALPENYYFYPKTTNALDDGDVQLGYTMTEGYFGTKVVRATDNPLVSGVHTPLADGIVGKLSDGVRAINKITFATGTTLGAADAIVIDGETLTAGSELPAAGSVAGLELMQAVKAAYEAAVGTASEAAAYLEVHGSELWVIKDDTPDTGVVDVSGWSTGTPPVSSDSGDTVAFPGMVRAQSFKFIGDGGAELAFTLRPEAVAQLAELDIDSAPGSQKQLLVSITKASGGSVDPIVSYNTGTMHLQITWDDTEDTLAAIRAEILGDTDVGDWFDATVLDEDQGEEVIASIEDATGSLGDGYGMFMLRDVYRVTVEPNPYVFATSGSTPNSAHFKTRGVVVGDRVRYSVVGEDSVVYEGTTYVTAIEADETSPMLRPATVNTDNIATQRGTVMAAGVVAASNDIIVPGAENRRDMDGAEGALFALSTTAEKYTGSYVDGIVADTFTVTITTPGAAGTARATVESVGGYYREDVPVEIDVAEADRALIYLGANLVMRLHQGTGDADALFQTGDTYTFSTDVLTPYNTIPASALTVTGQYRGPKDTTYVIEVVRGGVFTRTATVIKGIQSTTNATLTVDLDWQTDTDDEYILTCTSGGPLASAVFRLTSLLGDEVTGIQFADGVERNLTSVGIDGTMTLTGTPTFAVGDYWVIKVFGARPQIRVTDTAGVEQTTFAVVTPAETIDLGVYGAQVIFSTNRNTCGGVAAACNGGLAKGEVFYVEALAAGEGAMRTLVLADDLPEAVVCGREAGELTDTDYTNDWTSNYNPTEFAVWLYLLQESTQIDSKRLQTPPLYNWEASADSVVINEAIAVQDPNWVNTDGSQDYLPVYRGAMYLEYRALLPDYADGIYSINDIGDVVNTLGVVHPDNPLAQGVFNALANSGAQPVYFMGVPTNDLAGYLEVLSRASLVDTVYGFAPLTRDLQILTAIEGHINDLSAAESKRWRIGFVATDLPTESNLLTASTSADGATDWLATVGDNPGVVGNQNTLVTVTNGTPTLLTHVKVGDKVRVRFSADAWGTAAYEEYAVARVLTNNTLLLATGPAVSVQVASKIEIVHPLSKPEIAAAVKARSEGFGNRRLYHVFPNALFLDGVLQTGEFAAAAVAGLVSSVPPQQGLTNIEVNGFDDIPAVYRTFNREQLNTMASGGTMILMQDQAGGRIYVRHQVSTATVDGNLLTRELSITKNLDAVSYYMAAVLEPFYGRYNITPELLAVLHTQIQSGLNFLGSDRTAAGLLGPMVILENEYTKIRSVSQHPTLRDHIVIIVDLELPIPANVIQLRLVVGDPSAVPALGASA